MNKFLHRTLTVLTFVLAGTIFPNSMKAAVLANFTVSEDTLCAPGTVTFTNLSVGAVSYLWSFGDGSTDTTLNPSYTYYNAGAYTVTLVASDGLGGSDSIQQEIIIYDQSYSSLYTNKTVVCPGEPVNFSTYGSSYTEMTLNTGDGNTITSPAANEYYSYSTPGTYTASLEVSTDGYCPSSSVVTITVDASLTVNLPGYYYVSDSVLCPTSDLNYSLYNSDSTHASYMWNFGDGNNSTLSSGTHSYASAGNYILTLTASNFCGNSDTAVVTVKVDNTITPVLDSMHYGASYPYVKEISICPNTSVALGFDYGYYPADVKYMWYSGTGDSSDAAYTSFHYPSLGTYYATLVIKNGCDNYDTGKVKVNVVNTIPVYLNPADVTVYPSTSCPNTQIDFSLYNTGLYSSHIWNFGNGVTDSAAYTSYSYADTGSYNVEIRVFNSCGNYDSLIVPVSVTNTQPATLYAYDYGVSSSGGLITTDSVCPGEPVDFVFADYYSYYSGYEPLWIFGDGDSTYVSNPTHVYNVAGIYTAKLLVKNGCGNYDSGFVTIKIDTTLLPTASIYYYGTVPICPSDGIQLSGSGGLTYAWNFDDGSPIDSSQNPFHVFPTTGSYDVTLTVDNYCGNTDTAVFTIVADSTGGPSLFLFASEDEVCPGDSVYFEPSVTTYNSYLWNFGDGTTSNEVSPAHVYTGTFGYYTVYCVVTNSCGVSDTIYYSGTYGYIMVDTSLSPDVYFTYSSSLCQGDEIFFYPDNVSMGQKNNQSGETLPASATYVWDFGDGVSSTDKFPSHIYSQPGNYLVTLFYTNSCGNTDSYSELITVSQALSLSGTVTSSTGPVIAGNVYLVKFDTVAYEFPVVDTASIGFTGGYYFPAVPAGNYLIYAQADSILYPTAVKTFHTSEYRWDSSMVVTQTCQNPASADITLVELNLAPGDGKVSGTILEGTENQRSLVPGDPIPGIDVSLEQVPGGAVAMTVTDANGEYSFKNLPPATYTLWVGIPGLPMDSSYTITITSTDTVFSQLDFFVDSNSIYVDPLIGIATVEGNNFTASVFPNPFSSSSELSVNMKENGELNVEIMTLLGNRIPVLRKQNVSKGQTNFSLEKYFEELPSGIYFIRIAIESENRVIKVIRQ